MLFIGFVAVLFYLLYKRSTEIVVVNPMKGAPPAAPVLRGPEGSEPDAPPDFSRLLGTISEIAKEASQAPGSGMSPQKGRAAIRALVKMNRIPEAVQLYRRLYGATPEAARAAIETLIHE